VSLSSHNRNSPSVTVYRVPVVFVLVSPMNALFDTHRVCYSPLFSVRDEFEIEFVVATNYQSLASDL
jgi:hypothetical protein